MSMDRETYNKNFIIQIQALSYEKDFIGAFTNLKSSLNIFKSNKNLLFERKQSYNFAYVSIMNEYELDTTKIYDELDDLWNECIMISEYFYGKKTEDITDINQKILNQLSKYNRKITEHINPIMKFLDLNLLFKLYLEKCEELAKSKIEKIEKAS